MKKQQFEEILSGIGLIALLISYNQFGMNWVTQLILIKFIFDTYAAIKLAYKSVYKKK